MHSFSKYKKTIKAHSFCLYFFKSTRFSMLLHIFWMFNSNIQSSIKVRYFFSIFESIESSDYMTYTSILAKMYVVEGFRMALYIRTFADGLFLMMRIIMTRSFFRSFQLPFFCKKCSTSCESFVICDWKNKPSTPAIWQIENYSTLSTPAGYQSPFTNNHFPCMGGVQKVKVRTTNHSGSNIAL